MAERDIVERLHAETSECGCTEYSDLPCDICCLNLDAADEIERLRASTPEGSEEWTATVRTGPYVEIDTPGVRLTSGPFHDGTEAEEVAAELRKRLASSPSHDVEALREALEEVAQGAEYHARSYLGKIARRALAQHVGGEG